MNKDVKRLVEKIESLPALPGVVVRLIELTHSDQSDIDSIGQVIESDQAIASRILRVVNSPAYGFGSPVTTISRAVTVLGINATRCLVLGMGVAKLFPSNGTMGAFQYREFWKHSLACAVCARELAKVCKKTIDRDEAFIAGLLHDLGKLALYTCLGDEYNRVVAQTRDQGRVLLAVEQQMLHVDHTLAGKWLAERWGLPDLFVDVVWLHHQPPGTLTTLDNHANIVYLVQLADIIVRRLRIGYGGNGETRNLAEDLLAECSADPDAIAEIEAKIWKKVEQSAAMVDLELTESTLHQESLHKANQELSRLYLQSEREHRLLERRTRRLQALHDMNAKLHPGQPLGDVITILSGTLRDGFEMPTGICCVPTAVSKRMWGRQWRSNGPLFDFEATSNATDDIEGASLQGLDPEILSLLHEFAFTFKEGIWTARNWTEPTIRADYVVLPLVADGKTLGQVYLDLRGEQVYIKNDPGLTDLRAFSSAAGHALSRVHIHEALKRRSEELATAVWKVDQANRQILHSERLAAVGEMAAGAAHEVNNPLAIISGRAQMLSEVETEKDKQEKLQLIVEQCSRASKILSDLMRFARPALPKKELVNINTVVYTTIDMFRSRFERHGITIEEKYAENLPRVYIDQGQIEQVLVNLIINSEHAITPPGQLSIVTKHDAAHREIVLELEDTGCGIPQDSIGRIFEPFYTTKEEGKGTGLGLSLAHGIITKHQGTIQVSSVQGKGAKFIIHLPAMEQVDKHVPQVAQETPPKGKVDTRLTGKRVLVVDDEPEVRDLICEALKRSGYAIEQAANGQDALDSIRKKLPDLITLDIRMPRMDGMELLRAMREDGPEIPVILVTGFASEDEISQAHEFGVSACIRKPFKIGELLTEVKNILHQHQNQ